MNTTAQGMPPAGAPPPVMPPAGVTGVGPGEATAGSIAAGLLGYVAAYVANKYHLPMELVSGVLTLIGSAAMAVWHHLKA
jgi:hypothetical protein